MQWRNDNTSPHTATSLNESIKRKLKPICYWTSCASTSTFNAAHPHDQQPGTDTTEDMRNEEFISSSHGSELLLNGFSLGSSSSSSTHRCCFKHEYWGCGSVDATNIPNWMRHCYVSLYFCCYNRCQQAPSRGSPAPPYNSSTRALLQSCYTLQLGSICSPIPPLPLILVLILLLSSSCCFCFCFCSSRLCLSCPTRFPAEIPRPPLLSRKRSTSLSSDRDGYVRLKFRFPRSPGRERGGRSSGKVHGPPLRFRADFILYYFLFYFFLLLSFF